MRVGLALDAPAAPVSHAERCDAALALARRAEAAGFDSVWVAERHFDAARPEPAPELIAAALASETRELRIGMALALALHQPLRAAEDAAVLDLLSRGRLVFAADPAATDAELRAWGVDPGERAEAFREALELVRLAWTQDSFAYLGRRWRLPHGTRAVAEGSALVPAPADAPYRLPWQRAGLPFDYLSVLPKPCQIPHPPIFVVGRDEATARLAARAGHSLFLSAIETPRAALRALAAAYWEELARARRAREEVVLAVATQVCVTGGAGPARPPAVGDGALVGSADDVFAGARRLAQETGLRELVCSFALPGVEPEQVHRSLDLVASEVRTRLAM